MSLKNITFYLNMYLGYNLIQIVKNFYIIHTNFRLFDDILSVVVD